MISHSNGSNRAKTENDHKAVSPPLPWWTWVAPLFIANIGTPIDLARIIKINKPSQRVRYELQEIGQPTLQGRK